MPSSTFLELAKMRGAKVSKLLELIKIRGSCQEIEKKLQQKTHILCRSRFATVLDYFRRLEQALEWFEIYSEPRQASGEEQSEVIKTNKEQHRKASSSLSRSRHNLNQKGYQERKPNNTLSGKELTFVAGSFQPRVVFDFGLILRQCVTHYSGLLFAVCVKNQPQRRGRNGNSTSDGTLAFGGRFDNNVANFQFELL